MDDHEDHPMIISLLQSQDRLENLMLMLLDNVQSLERSIHLARSVSSQSSLSLTEPTSIPTRSNVNSVSLYDEEVPKISLSLSLSGRNF